MKNLCIRNFQSKFLLKPSSHARKFFVSSYENSVCSFILFFTKKFVHVTTLAKYVLKGLRTFVCPYEDCLRTKNCVRKESFLRHRKKNLLNLLQ